MLNIVLWNAGIDDQSYQRSTIHCLSYFFYRCLNYFQEATIPLCISFLFLRNTFCRIFHPFDQLPILFSLEEFRKTFILEECSRCLLQLFFVRVEHISLKLLNNFINLLFFRAIHSLNFEHILQL